MSGTVAEKTSYASILNGRQGRYQTERREREQEAYSSAISRSPRLHVSTGGLMP